MPEFIWELPISAVDAPASIESVPTDGRIDHVQGALNRLVQQFRGKPRIEALLRYLFAPFASLEQAFIDLFTKRTLTDAEGEQLAILGRIVGQGEVVDVDTVTFRSLVRARIPANKSNGMGDEVYKIVRLLLTDYIATPAVAAAGTLQLQIRNYGRAAFVIRVLNIDLPWDLATLIVEQFLRVIVDTGIRAVMEFTVQDADGLLFDAHDDLFELDDIVSPIPGDNGFGDTGDITTGGELTAAME